LAIFEASLRIFITFLIGYVGIKAIRLAITQLETLLIKASEDAETVPGMAQKRITTLTGLLQTLSVTVVWAIVIIMALDQLGFDITPVLASAGILGLAVGFGAQNLVRDVISEFSSSLKTKSGWAMSRSSMEQED